MLLPHPHPSSPTAAIKLKVLPAFRELWEPHRYKVYRGGRGSGKSFAVAEFLIIQALTRPVRILCAREFQNSIAESCHRLIQDRIELHGLAPFFTITNTSIRSTAGAECLFKGLSTGIESVKSTEGINYCWCEEADKISERSWDWRVEIMVRVRLAPARGRARRARPRAEGTDGSPLRTFRSWHERHGLAAW